MIERIAAALREEDPDPGVLLSLLELEYGLERERSRGLLCDVVARLNAGLFPPVTDLELVHTEGCNLACRYCFERATRESRDMTPEVARAAINLLFLYSRDRTTVRIIHFGGEPTLNPITLRAATEYAEERAAALRKNLDLHMTSSSGRSVGWESR